MDKENIISKLEKVFEVASDQYINNRGRIGSIKEIKELGAEIIHLKRNMKEDISKAEAYIDKKVRVHLDKNMHLTAKEMADSIASAVREIE